MSDTMRAALAKGRRLTPLELDDLNFVLDMMVRFQVLIISLYSKGERQSALCAVANFSPSQNG